MTLHCKWKLKSTVYVIMAVILIQHIQGQSEPQNSPDTKVDTGTPSEQSILDKTNVNSVNTVNETKPANDAAATATDITNKSIDSKPDTIKKVKKPIKPKRRRRPIRRRRPRRRQQRPKPKASAQNTETAKENKANQKQVAQQLKAEDNKDPTPNTEATAKKATAHTESNKKSNTQDSQVSPPNTEPANRDTKPTETNKKQNKQVREVAPPNTDPAKKNTKPTEPNTTPNKQASEVALPHTDPAKKDTKPTETKTNNKPNKKASEAAPLHIEPTSRIDQNKKQNKQATEVPQPNAEPTQTVTNQGEPNVRPIKEASALPPPSKDAPHTNTIAMEPGNNKIQQATEVSPLNNEPQKPKAKPAKSKTRKKPDKEPSPVAESSDSFFENIAFEGTTTTESPNEPPPEFNPNPKPKEKKIPVVDTANSKAYDGTACNVTYRPHETDRTKYMMRLPEDVWIAADCPPNRGTGLVWRQDLCSCGEELVAQDPDDWCGMMGFNKHPSNKHKYIRRHHGVDAMMDCAASLVWSQKECLCLYSSSKDKPMVKKVNFICKTILNLTFENDLRNTEGYYVKPVPLGRRSKISRIRYVKTQGSTNLAAQIIGQPLEFLAFSGNDFQKHVTYSLNFKVSPRRRKSDNFMSLFSDSCRKTKQWEPSIDLSFQPLTNSFRLVFRTDNKTLDKVITGAKPNKSGWYKTVVYFQDETVTVESNGQKLLTETGMSGKVPPNRCPLYIAGRGGGTRDKKSSFYGYMDNVFLMKDCKFDDANIKIL